MKNAVFYISYRPDLSPSKPFTPVQCGSGFLHRYLSRPFETLDEAVAWSRDFEAKTGFTLLSREQLPEWFTKWALGGSESSAVRIATEETILREAATIANQD